jgi:hypothetical protein
VTLTDLADHVPILEANLAANAQTIAAARDRRGMCDAGDGARPVDDIVADGVRGHEPAAGCEHDPVGREKGACDVAQARALKWGRMIRELDHGGLGRDGAGGGQDWSQTGCDVVLGSDIVYEPKSFSALAETLVDLLQVPGSQAYIAHRPRHPDEHIFWAQVKQDFHVENTHFVSKAYPHVTDVTVYRLVRL